MKITDALLGEHAVLYELCDNVEQIAHRVKSVDEMRPLCGVLHACIESHSRIEDRLLFPAVAPLMPQQAAILDAFRRDHEVIATNLEDLPYIKELDRFRDKLATVLRLVREHFHNEEQGLFDAIARIAGEERLTQLAVRWAADRGVQSP